tara:strand:+ start:1979 stop:2212 length:234 start_codon:yes stop_codon:yes gene_type:complete
MNKQTKKFKVVTEEHLTFTHEIEVPISLLDEHPEFDDIEFVEEYYPELFGDPDLKTKTSTCLAGLDTQVSRMEVTDE